MKKKETGPEKTNVMRILDGAGVPYLPHTYPLRPDGTAPSGTEICGALGKDPETVFKTLVTRGASGRLFVFAIPVHLELDLKKAARAVGEKSVEMIKSRELLPLTGYVHGGCSPIGMKKDYPVTFHERAPFLNTVTFSAGKIGYQVEVSPRDLAGVLPFSLADLT